MMTKTPAPSAKTVPGAANAEARVKGARPAKPVQIDAKAFANPKGSAPFVASDGVQVKDNRSKLKR
jgi:hypothetical protein